MRLYMSGKKAWNSTFSTENGDVIYETWSPRKIFGRTTTISRIEDPNGQALSSHLAQYAWRTFCSARLRFRNQEVRTRSFFKKKGWGIHGRDRVFEIDGYQFRWKLGSGELRLNKHPHMLVARYFPKGKEESFSSKANRPFLEIMSGWKNFADDIMISFIYVEKLVEDE
ncbi:hypothetical protein C0993_012034 [Termitomyces sp. T159_Od127]|nr:hypothetical protein C0993_012034 [Termitomyces sp. T159_Od127]